MQVVIHQRQYVLDDFPVQILQLGLAPPFTAEAECEVIGHCRDKVWEPAHVERLLARVTAPLLGLEERPERRLHRLDD